MCEQEYQATILNGKADFSKSRFKWFSPSLEFIKSRVRDGRFNNSAYCPNRYKRILKFEIPFDYAQKELQIDRRKNITIKYISEELI